MNRRQAKRVIVKWESARASRPDPERPGWRVLRYSPRQGTIDRARAILDRKRLYPENGYWRLTDCPACIYDDNESIMERLYAVRYGRNAKFERRSPPMPHSSSCLLKKAG